MMAASLEQQLSDSEDLYEDTFDFFKKCGDLYLDTKKACKSINVKAFQNEELEEITSKTNDDSEVDSMKDEVTISSTQNDMEAISDALPVSESAPGRCTRSRRKRGEPENVNVPALPDTGRQKGCRGRKRKGHDPPVTLPDPVLILDSDDDDVQFVNTSTVSDGLNNSFVDDNYEMPVKVWWRFGEIHKFSIRRHQKLSSVFEFFSKVENVPQEQILLTVHDTVSIKPTDTPDDLKLNIVDVIEGGVTTYKIDKSVAPLQNKPQADENTIPLKLQLLDRKEPLVIHIRKDQHMQTVMTKCSEQMDIPLDKLKFSFDGEPLESNTTPDELDLEGGECIDVRIIK